MREFRLKFADLARNHFIGRLTEWETWARQQHNGTFDQSDYLSATALQEKFGFTTEMQPVPCGEDFRIDCSEDELNEMRSQVDSRVAEATDAARKDLWRRLKEPVANMVERLKDPDSKFRDSLVGNIRDIVALIPALNVTQDQDLDTFSTQIQRELSVYGPDTLRDDKITRAQVAAKADAILAKMKDYVS